jgi:hypothetical protein
MKIPEQSNTAPHAGGETLPQTVASNASAKEKLSFPAIVANTFSKLDVALRARLLGRLLGSVGPLALLVIGGGVFAKYVRHARVPEIPVSFNDAARATSSQVYELVRYLEQSNPNFVQGLLAALSITVAGASIAAVAMKRVSERKAMTRTAPASRR